MAAIIHGLSFDYSAIVRHYPPTNTADTLVRRVTAGPLLDEGSVVSVFTTAQQQYKSRFQVFDPRMRAGLRANPSEFSTENTVSAEIDARSAALQLYIMKSAVATLLRRLSSVVVGASFPTNHAIATEVSDSTPQMGQGEAGILQHAQRPQKLIFGRARRGHLLLASHSSHSSHASHSSHYSGSSGGGYTSPPTDYSTPPSQPSRQTPTPPSPPPVAHNDDVAAPDDITARVLKKLPHIRSRWPYEARLTKKCQFTLYDGDRAIGVVTLNPDTKVSVVAITLQHAIVTVTGHESPIPVLNTDIIDRMGGAEKILAYPDDSTSSPDTKSQNSEKK